MSTSIIVKSVLHPDKFAYDIRSDYSYLWNARGERPLSMYIGKYETYGDGTTKHSHSWVAQFSDMTDVLLGIIQAYLADPGNEAWGCLSLMVCDIPEDAIRFALSVKHVENKDQWYTLAERKVSSAESRRHDRRWEKVEPWMDGTGAAALGIICKDKNHYDWLTRVILADDIRTISGYSTDWEELFKPEALHAFKSLRRAHLALDYAKRAYDCALRNSLPKEEEKPAAAAA